MRVWIITLLLIAACPLIGQQDQLPEFHFDESELEAKLRFFASDALKGRKVGSETNNIAAAFIADHLRAYGYDYPPGYDSYYQKIPFEIIYPPKNAYLKLGKKEYTFGDDFVVTEGAATVLKANAVFAEHGWIDESGKDDYEGLDVVGKVVIVLGGYPGGKGYEAFRASDRKKEIAAEKGAVALLEIYSFRYPWKYFSGSYKTESLNIRNDKSGSGLVHAWIQDQGSLVADLKKGKKVKVKLEMDGVHKEDKTSSNVLGVIEGTDPELKEEYIVLTAHYDHVGVSKPGSPGFSAADSIYNGARDNGIGVIGLLATAKALAEKRPKRSVLVLAVTAEEIGLVGSSYYVANPAIPLEKTVFNFNSDGAGYTDTTAVSILGTYRTGTDDLVLAGVTPFGLELVRNPAPEQGLYDRSDNVSFARKGVPSVSFAPGFREFNEELMKHYHQVSDEVDGLNFRYVKKFCQAFAHAVRLIADSPTRPQWEKGDKYEEASQKLYNP